MNILTQIAESDSVRSLTAAATKFIDKQMQSEYFDLSSLLSAQRFAGYMGLKKLVEKDYSKEDEPRLLSLVNT
jgi:hypothetical protein